MTAQLVLHEQCLPIVEETVGELARHWEGQSPTATIERAVEAFGESLVLACSFGSENVVLIDLLTRVWPEARALFIDTGYHFAETLELKDRILERYPRLRLEVAKPLLTVEEQQAHHGERLFERQPDQCCALRKVEPLNRALRPYKAWMTGMRRDQAHTRTNLGVIQWDAGRGMVKFNPLANWTDRQIWTYIFKHQLPYNPLHDQGYPSIGCSPVTCTAAVLAGADSRSGRWQGKAKTECGLHL